MPTLREDIEVQQGATFQWVIQLTDTPGSISGYACAMQIRPFHSSEEVFADWSTDGGEISVNDATKQIVVDVDDSVTAAYDWDKGVYDIELSGGGDVWRVAAGVARLSREVTR